MHFYWKISLINEIIDAANEFVFKINAKMFIKYVCRKKWRLKLNITKKTKNGRQTPVTVIHCLCNNSRTKLKWRTKSRK